MTEVDNTTEQQVCQFLEAHPDFLSQHPGLLEKLQLQHSSGTATSLIEHQVKQLRQKNRELTRRLRQLVQIASENEKLMSQLHQLTLQLIPIADLSTFFEQLVGDLRREFNAECVSVHLFSELPDLKAGLPVRSVDQDEPELKQFSIFLDNQRTTCGRLNRSKLDFLFGPEAEKIQSSAMVPLGKAVEYGILAIGSSDPARFFPGMGTLFLDLLGDVISHRLSVSELEPRRLTA